MAFNSEVVDNFLGEYLTESLSIVEYLALRWRSNRSHRRHGFELLLILVGFSQIEE
jgi:hypothetical protein